jgi:uncharacterized membrane protein YeaQ/YmgE (transglycosylase-associated protein family)
MLRSQGERCLTNWSPFLAFDLSGGQEQLSRHRLVSLGASQERRVSIIGWIVLGLISGFIASKIVNKTGDGVVLDIVLGIVGAIVGGFLFAQFGANGVTGFNLYSMFVAIVGAVVVLFIYHAVVGRRSL